MQRRARVPAEHTRDPWPCCGKAADEQYGRFKEGVCKECARLIAIGRESDKRAAEGGEKLYRWVDLQHHWPRYYGRYTFSGRETGDELAEAMFDLAERLTRRTETCEGSRDAEHLLECKDTSSRYEHTMIVRTAEPVRDRLNRLDAMIRRALGEAYTEGKARGQSIVMQLAAGELSTREFDKQEEDARRRRE